MCMTNYMKTCSFLHAHFNEIMEQLKWLRFVKISFGEKTHLKDIMLFMLVHVGIVSI